jgi:hypothetical protein
MNVTPYCKECNKNRKLAMAKSAKERRESYRLKHGGIFCKQCGVKKSTSLFKKRTASTSGFASVCKHCNYKYQMLYSVKKRATRLGITFDITPDDIVIPKFCPLLGIELKLQSGTLDDSPSVDRIDANIGYIKSNVWVISYRANRAKNNLSLVEITDLFRNWVQADVLGYPKPTGACVHPTLNGQ